jgi:hypothetical protein
MCARYAATMLRINAVGTGPALAATEQAQR